MNPPRSNSSIPKPGRSAYGVVSAVVLLLIPVVVLAGGNAVRDFLNFGAGVLSLVSLSCSVIWGLVAQDRIFLNIRQRIVAQAVHRTTAVASIAFLLVHVTVKLALDHTVLIAALVPFSLGVSGSAGLIGLGSLAALLMIFVGVTGALRGNFASPAPVAARWRAMHMLAYPSWCAALVHGLYAGRAAKPFFTISYELCLLGVMAALALRAAPRPFKRKVADRIFAIVGSGDRFGRDDLDASRARNAEAAAAMAGFGPRSADRGAATEGLIPSQPSTSLYDTPPARTMTPESGNGFAAAYRAVSATPRAQGPMTPDATQRMNPVTMQQTGAMPRVDGPGSTSGSWPVPSPPPVGEAPPSAYDPLQDTGYNIPTYGSSGYDGYGGGEMYDTSETNSPYGTYNSNNTYNSGPATDTAPGAYGTPGAGEPWNAPSGGF
ncbi:ferric reductase-like transmembrane domain-containing protein [Streptomyces sp. NPDC093228]|uniref:ferric reductase-like transmembrane domain-containing protein n=1 Tax=unclassified Streptomyces TaxID=2593676 RepID=UPI000A3EEB8E|nr:MULTISPECIES: ferric reductase-like transmembrane domain-containing protein [unclassified Streptomyces]MDX3258016.1 ferric reductase-like transmembrane domain-containing protein [Streptomyces sp. MI02-2A]REE60669.1 DMSO/TMAO reductase YedYZ heme-binding membrane subunit [Streptomyces sp. 3212.3]